MSPLMTYSVLFFMGVYGLIILVDLFTSGARKRAVGEAIALGGVFLLLNVTTGFPAAQQSFGAEPIAALGIMGLCVLCGMAAHYFFFLQRKWSWKSFLRPFFVSPLVLLPLIGSVSGVPSIEPIQLISFGFLAFQNGFFWREVFEHAKANVASA